MAASTSTSTGVVGGLPSPNEITLHRVDLIQAGALSPNCVKVLPLRRAGSNSFQRLVVGTQAGTMHIVEVKENQSAEFSSTSDFHHCINHLHLAGPVDKPKDRVFIGAGSKVYGVSRKGKVFFQLDTNQSDSVTSLAVDHESLYTCGEHSVSYFEGGADAGFYQAHDKVNALVVIKLSHRQVLPVLACEDAFIRVLDGMEVLLDCATSGPVTALAIYAGKGASMPGAVVYGTRDGAVGLVDIEEDTVRKLWRNGESEGAVTCIHSFVNDEKTVLVAVGRDDGTVELINPSAEGVGTGFVDSASTEASRIVPPVVWRTSLNESITAVASGCFTKGGHADLVVATFSGKIIVFTRVTQTEMSSTDRISGIRSLAENPLKAMRRTQKANSGASSVLGLDRLTREDRRLADAEFDIDELRSQVDREKAKYQKFSGELIPMQSTFNVRSSFALMPDRSMYELVLEADSPIDNIIFRSTVPVEIVSASGGNSDPIINRSPRDDANGNVVLATLRCGDDTRRVGVRIRTIEGQHGTISCYVVSAASPKSARMITARVHPLSLHRRVHALSPVGAVNTLSVTGSFSLGELHSWIAVCLPEVPSKEPPGAPDVTYYFQSTLLDTSLVCECMEGSAIFNSDSVSTISILKEVVSREATHRKVSINFDFNISDSSIDRVLELLDPELTYQLGLAHKVALIDAIRELAIQDPDISYLPAELQEISASAAALTDDHKGSEARLSHLFGIVTDLYIDKFKFRGKDATRRVPALMDVLNSYSLAALRDFFAESW